MDAGEGARLRRDIAWNVVPVALLAIVGLGLNFAIAWWWGEAALGSFSLVTIAFFSVAVLGACGVQYAVLRAVAEDPEDRDRVASVVVGALIPVIVIAGLATLAFALSRHAIGAMLDKPGVARGMAWAAPGLFCFALNKVLLGVVNGLRRMRAFAVYTSLRYVMIAVGLVAAKLAGLDGDRLPVIWTFTEGVLLLVLVVEVGLTVSLRRGVGWIAHARAHLDFGVRGVLSTLAFEVNSKLDVWMLGVAVDSAKVGVYSLASAVFEGVLQLAVIVQNNVNPILARETAAGEVAEIEALAKRTRRWFVPALVGIAAVGAALFPLVIPWLTGSAAFYAGSLPFALMMAGVALASPWLPFGQFLLMANRPGWQTAYVLVVLVVNFVGNLLLIGPLGLVGAAISAGASLVVASLLVRGLVRRTLGVRI